MSETLGVCSICNKTFHNDEIGAICQCGSVFCSMNCAESNNTTNITFKQNTKIYQEELKSCCICKSKFITDENVLKFMLQKYSVTKEQIIQEIYKEEIYKEIVK